MGCNAIRMSHNPPAPELLDAADSLGFVVIDEIFDEWNKGKTKAGYSQYFNDWYERDIANWVCRDRNHPSIIAWSIGNEVPEQWDEVQGPKIAKMLIETVHKYDTSRPTTAGCNGIPNVNSNGMGELLGIVGYNYHEALYKDDHQRYPNRVIFGSETLMYPYHPGDCWQLHSYEEWLVGQFEDYVAGEFIWTGFDYIGESGLGDVGTGCNPWEQWPGWPWRGASCGLVDACGFEKPAYWFRKALWTKDPMVYIAVETNPSAKNREVCSFWSWPKVESHWNYPKEGDTLAVQVYTNVQHVELFMNGKTLGKKLWNIKNEAFLVWNVPYQKGNIKAIGTTSEGKEVSFEIKTAGEPAKIRLIADKNKIAANKQDLCYVKAILLDQNDIPVPFAENKIEFEVKGAGILYAVGNGNQQSHTSNKGNQIESFQGKSLAIIKSTKNKGEILLKARSKNLPEAKVVITSN
jgi:beta-galactosidase